MLGKPRTDKPALRLEGLEVRDTPAIIANGDTYFATAGQVLSVPLSQGVLVNDFSDTFPNAQLTAAVSGIPQYVPPTGSTVLLPPVFGGPDAVTLNPDGSFTFVAPSANLVPAGVSQVFFDYTVTNNKNEVGLARVIIDLGLNRRQIIAVGAEAGGTPIVRGFDAGTGAPLDFIQSLVPYEGTFTGGVRVAVGDVNRDGTDDIVTVPAFGGSARVVVFSGKDGSRLIDQIVFDPDFRGGAYVAVGDVNGDSRPDIVIGAGESGGPRVQVLEYVPPVAVPAATGLGTLNLLTDFFVFEDTARTGVRVAAGDLRGEGRDLLVVSPGVGGGPRVRVIDPQATGIVNQLPNNRPIPAGQVAISVRDFFAADASARDGVFIATGDLRGDGKFDILTGSGGGSALVQVFDGRTAGLVRQFAPPAADVPTGFGLTGVTTVNGQQPTGTGTLLNTAQSPGSLVPGGIAGPAGTNPFFGNTTGGIRVAATDYNGDGLDDLVLGSGPGNAPRVRVYDTRTFALLTSIQPFESSFLGGVNVGAN
jgi:hypothetical protein